MQADIVFHQQQRLLLLRHASKCKVFDGTCLLKERCNDLKDLWKHIFTCKEFECPREFCKSSKLVCRHFSGCKEETCIICSPVKHAIRDEKKRVVESTTASPSSSSTESPPSNSSPFVIRTPKRLCTECSKHFIVQEGK